MAYTLISMIGTGMYKTSKDFEGYVETNYFFKENYFKTRLFMQAIVQKPYKPIDQIILLGTDTSSWDCLVDKDEDNREETIELWISLFDQCESKNEGEPPLGVSRENLDRLKKYLSERFKLDVVIKCHSPNIDETTSEELFNCYTEVTDIVKKGNDILFDITHGFRSMPVLLYQSLQYSLSQKNRKVEIIYGELDINDKSKGYARDLSSYWSYSELAVALNVFKSKLDGFKLAELIEPYWDKGSKAIKHLSEIVQTNFAFQIEEVCRQIKNALDKFPTDAPKYLHSIKTFLKEICDLVDEESTSKTLFKYSQFLYSHNLNVQAIITLQITVEAVIIEKYANPERFGDYDWWKEQGKGFLDTLKRDHWKEIKEPLNNLEYFRNQIAHGGGRNKDGDFPHAANIPGVYESGKKGVEKLFEILKKE